MIDGNGVGECVAVGLVVGASVGVEDGVATGVGVVVAVLKGVGVVPGVELEFGLGDVDGAGAFVGDDVG